MGEPDPLNALLEQIGRNQQSQRGTNRRALPNAHSKSENLPFDGSQIYRDLDTYDHDPDGYDPETPNESYPDHVYEPSQGRGRISLPPPGQLTLFEPTRYASQPQSPSFQYAAPYSPYAGPDMRPWPHQRPERRPLQALELSRTPTRPTRQLETDSVSSFFADSSPTPARPQRWQDQQSPRPHLPPQQSVQTEPSFDNVENEPPQHPAPPRIPRAEDQNIATSTARTAYQAPVSDQGIQLIPVCQLPDSFRNVFPYSIFNAVQSKCFPHVIETDDNLVMSAPTGSGKTVILELAITRLILTLGQEPFKAVYMAPTKALCSERYQDWTRKFHTLGLKCAEVTGDTNTGDAIASIQDAHIIIATPEKWDSATRKWNEHKECMDLVKLLLIDEVHMLKDPRGATLEAVVSRMRTIGAGVRFVALSATVPNADDVARWLGKSPAEPQEPARMETFGEEFRPVKLDRYVYGYNATDWALDEITTTQLPDIMTKHARGHPILVFCPKRASCEGTARLLRDKRSSHPAAEKWWKVPLRPLAAADNELNEVLRYGVAFHHAGLSVKDRELVEDGFQRGGVSVICCTSTLAIGVNTPCHLAIIKGTMGYSDNRLVDYSDLDAMQMIGRAGRPQFRSQGAVAVIMTQNANKEKFSRLASGQDPLESCLHFNLIEHINAEIVSGSIKNMETAHTWLKSTFLYVRLGQNGNQYQIPGDSRDRSTRDQQIDSICRRDVNLLVSKDLALSNPELKSTAFGDAMARYCISFKAMVVLLGVPKRATISQMLSKLCEALAVEAKQVKLKLADRNLYKALSAQPEIRYPLEKVEDGSDKCSLIVQAALGTAKLPSTISKKARMDYDSTKKAIFKDIHRMARCVIDCRISQSDAEAVRNGLMLARSLSASAWDDWSDHLRQLPGIGPVFCHKLGAVVGIRSIADLAEASPAEINMKLGKNSKGENWVAQAKSFPLPTVTVTMNGTSISPCSLPVVNFKIQIGFMNGRPPNFYQQAPVFVCLMVERSDGHLVDFRRLKAAKAVEPILLCAEITDPEQRISCHVMCDDLAGTSQCVELSPELPRGAFGNVPLKRSATSSVDSSRKLSKKPSEQNRNRKSDMRTKAEEDNMFGLSDIEDDDLIAAESFSKFRHIEDFEEEITPKSRMLDKAEGGQVKPETKETRRRPDGKFDCNHTCKDKNTCKHLCCREGLEKPPKPPKSKSVEPKPEGPRQGKLQLSTRQKPLPPPVSKPEAIDKRGKATQLEKPDADGLFEEIDSDLNFDLLEGVKKREDDMISSGGRNKPTLKQPEIEKLLDEMESDFEFDAFGKTNNSESAELMGDGKRVDTQFKSDIVPAGQLAVSPSNQNTSAVEESVAPSADQSRTMAIERICSNAPEPPRQPFRDMTGIDPAILNMFGDFVDFKDD